MNINLRALPFGTQDFINRLGEDLAFCLMEYSGGRYLSIPAIYVDGKRYALLDVMSEENLQRLIKYYAGERLLVPKYDKIAKQLRDERIRTLRGEGKTIIVLAAQFKLTERQVYTICDQILVEDTAQEPDLFGESRVIKQPTRYKFKPVSLGLDELIEIEHGLQVQIMQHDYFVQNEPDQNIKNTHKRHIGKAESALNKVVRAKKQLINKIS